MEITKATKLKDILEEYPQLRNILPEINPKFNMINSPMGKIMINKVTITDMSKKSGIATEELIENLKEIVR